MLCKHFYNYQLFFRYEDLSTRPIEVASKIYNFVGLDFPPQMKRWIVENTRGSNSGKKHNPYGTANRDSAATSQAWRRLLSIEEVKIIQRSCSIAMQRFGYKPVWSDNELLDFNQTLFF